MIFHWGTKEKKITDTNIDRALCPNCANNKFNIIGWVTYLHIFWIPIYIRSKKLVIYCRKCKKPIDINTIPEDFYKKIKSLVFPSYKIFIYFSGIILILLLMLFGLYINALQKSVRLSYISEPQINDIYLVQLNKILHKRRNPYGFLMLQNIKGNVLQFKLSKLSFEKYKSAYDDLYNWKVFQDYYYTDEILSITKIKLLEYEKKGLIEEINRRNK